MRWRGAARVDRDRRLSGAAINIEVRERCIELASRKGGLDLGGADLDLVVNNLLGRKKRTYRSRF